jgi:formate dehydrogenase subunit gamma
MTNGNMVRKATSFEILNHWVMAISCIVLMISGYAFLFHLESVGSVFGGFPSMKVVHNWLGVVFIISLFLTLFNYLGEALDLSADDWQWIMVGGGYLSKKVTVPPMGKLNTGQKLYYLALLLFGVIIAASGFIIWLMPGARGWVLASHLFHNLAFDFFVVAVPVHIYLGTFANPGTFRIMIYGTVPLAWAKKKYPKWIKEMRL